MGQGEKYRLVLAAGVVQPDTWHLVLFQINFSSGV